MAVIATQKLTGITVTTGAVASTTATVTITNAASPQNSNYCYGWYMGNPSGFFGGNGGTTEGYSSYTTSAFTLPLYQFIPVFMLPGGTNWLGYDGVTYQNKPNGTIQATFTSSSTPAANIVISVIGGGGEPV